MIRRINLFAGPGCGKSTLSAYLFHELKEAGVSVELVREFIKDWAYDDIKPRSFDQFYIMGEQMRREDIPLRNGVRLIVTDSPILLGSLYSNDNISSITQNTVRLFDEEYTPLNIVLGRDDKRFKQEGRWQNLDESKIVDKKIEKMLGNFYGGYMKIDRLNEKGLLRQRILDIIKHEDNN